MPLALTMMALLIGGSMPDSSALRESIRNPAGHKLLNVSLNDIARDYKLGWPTDGEAGHMVRPRHLCYHIPETDTVIRFSSFTNDSTSLSVVSDLPPFEKPPSVYAHFTMLQATDELDGKCETLRSSKAKDIIVGVFWIGQAQDQALKNMRELSDESVGNNCTAFNIKVPFEPERLGVYRLSDGNPEGAPYMIERYKTCLAFSKEKLVRFDIDASLLTTKP